MQHKRTIISIIVLGLIIPFIALGGFLGWRYYKQNQTPRVARLTIPLVRTIPDLAGRISHVIDADSIQLLNVMTDSVWIDSLGYSPETAIAMYIPNTYEVYQWVSPRSLLLKLKHENEAYWTPQRCQQASLQGLSPIEVITLASIIEQETANDAERPMVAGMYLNRLRRDMLLQADPTVKYALGNFTLKRVLHEHLEIDNPYNTYKYPGLPPGPICIPSLASINAVLNPATHNYIYMCAKEDFSGTHNFAETYAQHLKNAHAYARALNEAGY